MLWRSGLGSWRSGLGSLEGREAVSSLGGWNEGRAS